MPDEKRNLLGDLNNLNVEGTPTQPAAPAAPVFSAPVVEPVFAAPVVEPVSAPQPTPSAPAPAMGGLDINSLATIVAAAVNAAMEKNPAIMRHSEPQTGLQTPNAEDILPETETVIFAARGTGYHTHSYERSGVISKAPYGCISFVETITDIVTNAAGVEDILHICTYACRSKKVLAYLRNHPELGISFAEVNGDNLNQMISNPKYMEAQTTIAYYNKAKSLPDDVKMQMAENYGISIHDPNVNIDYELMEIWREEDKKASESMRARREESFTTSVK